jgi:hypothetical protein
MRIFPAGDNAKAFLFAHVAPLADDTSESLSTLTFAKRASEVTLGKPTRRVIKSSSERFLPLTCTSSLTLLTVPV